jgi:ethanolamine ammonia-lyase small subunit
MSSFDEAASDASVEIAPSSHGEKTDALTESLRGFTPARVGLRRAGTTLATAEILDFQLAHALARDAVKAELDIDAFAERVRGEVHVQGFSGFQILSLKSAAANRETYLRRPDLGRILDPSSASHLNLPPCDVLFVIADGLSMIAVERHAIPLLNEVLPVVITSGWSCGPICVVKQARVAIGDPIGAALGSSLSVVLIGERPGLSSPDSLGVYVTWNPRPGRSDAERNCISNIRGGGLSYEAAAKRLLWYLGEARSRHMTGIALKEQGNPLLNG